MSDEQDKIRKSDEEWRKSLTDVQFTVCRLGGTEPAFSGEYWDTKAPGIYACAACGQDLFDSDSKFDSGTGWPSFFQPIDKDRVIERRDTSHGMIRTEILCARCDSHLGHLFPDGPEPTGLRFCMNSAALDLKPRDGD